MPLEFPHSALWWRGKVRLKGGWIVPEERKPYNPFEFYFPAGTRPHKEGSVRSIPYRFLDVDSDDTKRVIEFCEEFGVLGSTKHAGWKTWAINQVINVFSPTRGSSPLDQLGHRLKYRQLASDKRIGGLPPLSSLARSMRLTEFHSAKMELQETLDWMRLLEKGSSKTSPPVEETSNNLRLRFGQKLSMLRPYIRWDSSNRQWITGWDPGSLESLLYFMVLLDSQGGSQLRECPRCKKVFMRGQPKMKYCSARCGNAARVKKSREKAKSGKA